MKHPNDSQLPEDLVEVEARLREERPRLSPLELDELQRAVHRGSFRRRPGLLTRPKGLVMRSRLALMAILALGILMSGSGATLAITGVAGNDDASVSQYGLDERPDQEGPDENGPDDRNDILGPVDDEGGAPTPTEQVAAADDAGGLPFTGFLAIPLLIGGVALTMTGFVLRRKASEPDST